MKGFGGGRTEQEEVSRYINPQIKLEVSGGCETQNPQNAVEISSCVIPSRYLPGLKTKRQKKRSFDYIAIGTETTVVGHELVPVARYLHSGQYGSLGIRWGLCGRVELRGLMIQSFQTPLPSPTPDTSRRSTTRSANRYRAAAETVTSTTG